MTPDHDSTRGSLPELLLRHRLAAGLTQAELADRARVGVRTVRDLERGRSSRPQRATVDLLATALGLTGVARETFFALARGHRLPTGAAPTGPTVAPDSTVAPDATTLPGPSWRRMPTPIELVGRDDDVRQLAELLTAGPGGRLPVISLVGLAGVGKTALALAAARATRMTERAGVVVGEEFDPGDVLTAVASVFGVARPSELATALTDGVGLMVVDAADRAPAAVAEALERLAVIAPGLRVLVTGRHPLGLSEERVWPVPPLEVPPPETPAELGELARYPAVALFLARLGQVRRDPLRADELPALGPLVRQLGGLPVAIELVAARGRILDLPEMVDRYGGRVLDLATPTAPPDMPTTLRDAVAASYRLLAPEERWGLHRLATFRNRWSVELAEKLLTDDDPAPPGIDPVALLDRLLELGLLNVRGPGEMRFRLLDVVRDLAVEEAERTGEDGPARRRHAVVLAGWAGRVAPELAGVDLGAAVRRLDEVSADLSAALTHATSDDPHTALDLAASLARWWRFRGRDVFGRRWLRRLLDDPRTADADPTVRAWAMLGAARLAAEHGAGAEELPAARAALAEFRRVADLAGELDARTLLCRLLTASGVHDESREHCEQVLVLATRAGRIREMAVAQNNLTWHEIRVGDLRAAARRLAEVDRLAARCGDLRLRVLARANLAEVSRLDGRYGDAVDQGRRVLAALPELGDPGHRLRVQATVGLALAWDGRLAEATEVLAQLRTGTDAGASSPEPGGHPEDAVCAALEATIALRRGDRQWAAHWFATAAAAAATGLDRRDVAEALAGLVASTDDPTERATAHERLLGVCRAGGIRLLRAEQALIAQAGLTVTC